MPFQVRGGRCKAQCFLVCVEHHQQYFCFAIQAWSRATQGERAAFGVLPGFDGERVAVLVEPADIEQARQHFTVAE